MHEILPKIFYMFLISFRITSAFSF